jgi:hypothetical protein
VYVDHTIVVISTPEATSGLLRNLKKEFALKDLALFSWYGGHQGT